MTMICHICGAEYEGSECPACHTPAVGAPDSASKQDSQDSFEQFDYFPHRSEIRNMDFPNQEFSRQGEHTGNAGAGGDRTWHNSSYEEPGVSIGGTSGNTGWQQGQHIGGNAPYTQSQANYGNVPYTAAGHTYDYQNQNHPNQQPGYQTCPKCGNIVHGSFCGQCGYYAGPQQQRWQGSGQPGYNAPPKKMSSGLIALIVILVVLGVGFLFTFTFMFFRSVDRIIEYGENNQGSYGSYYDYFNDDYYDGFFDDYYDDYYDDFFEDYYGDFFGDEYYEDFYDYFYDYFNEYYNRRPGEQSSDSDAGQIPDDEGESLLPSGVSRAEYKQLKVGMTYTEVSFIIGGDGEIIDYDDDSFTAVWSGEYDLSAVVTIVFENQRAMQISQDGLY